MLSAGCGVGEYQQRINKGVKELSSSSVYQEMHPATTIGQTLVEVRVPKEFPEAPLVENPAAPDQMRMKPLGVDLPGLSQTFEGTIEDEKGGKIPFYLYLAAINKKDTPRGGDNMAGSIGTRFRPLFTGGNFTWQRVQAPTPQGAGLQWQHLRLNANQPFRYVSPDGEVEKVEMPGVLELYYRAEGDWLVTIAWRVPQSITGSVELSRWAPLVAGTVKVGKTSGDDPE